MFIPFSSSYECLVYVPANVHIENTKYYPAIVFLHGVKERGTDLELLKKNALPKKLVDNEEFPFLLLVPQCPPKEHWIANRIKTTLDQFIQEYPADRRRIYLTGLSMGGFGAFHLAGTYPSYFAALAPICGGGRREDAAKLKKIPTWVFHGAKDSVVPIIRSEEMVSIIQKCNGDVKFTIYPEGEHDVWTETYDNPELYEWFLKHSKK